MVHIYNGMWFSHKKDEIMSFAATWMELEIIILSEVSQKDKYHIISLICGILKCWHKWTYLQNKNRLTDVENRLVAAKDWKFGMSRCKLLYIGWINKVLLYITGNYIQYLMIYHNGKEYKKWIYITESLCYVAEINATLWINYTSIKFEKKINAVYCTNDIYLPKVQQ